MSQPILHIPHSSSLLPHREGFMLDKWDLEQEILKLIDWYADDLFSVKEAITIKSEFSRIFCDVERFAHDKQEVMAQYGMGVLYEKTYEGKELREITPEFKESILKKYYYPHHKSLEYAITKQLKANGKALILDCHSFPDGPLRRDLDQKIPRPDFCVGTNPFHTPEELIKAFATEIAI